MADLYGPNVVVQGYSGLNGSPVTYGYGGSGSAADLYTPTSGSIYGGDEVIILDNVLSVSGLEDHFEGVTLSAARWTTSTSGSGVVAVNNGLKLTVGTAAGVARVNSKAQYGDFDVGVKFNFNESLFSLFPQAATTIFALEAFIDVNNYVRAAYIWESNTVKIAVSVKSNGVDMEPTTKINTVESYSLRMRRVDGAIQVFAGNEQIAKIQGWNSSVVYMGLLSSTDGPLPQALNVSVSEYVPNLIVTFNGVPSPSVTVAGTRLYVSTPESIRPGPSTVQIRSNSLIVSMGTTFEYVLERNLELSSDGTLSIRNDRTLRNSSDTLKGLRL